MMPCPAALIFAMAAGLSSQARALRLDRARDAWAQQPPSRDEVELAAQRMADEPWKRELVTQGCQTIGNHASTSSSKDWMLPFVPMVMKAMYARPEDKGVQRPCAYAVAMMSLYSKGNMEAAGQAGAVERLVAIERQGFEDREAQIGGLMGCFMDFSFTNRYRWAEVGGIDLNMASIKHYFNDSEIVVQGWYAFSSGTQPPNTERFVKSGGVDLAIQTMRSHPKGYRVREETMQAMRAVGRDASLSQQAADQGWLEEVVTALREAPLDLHQQSAGCANLAIFAAGNAKQRARAVLAGAVGAAVEGLRALPKMKTVADWPKDYEKQYTVREDCMDALAAMAEDDPIVKRQLLDADLGNMTAQMLMDNSANARLQTAGSKVLAALKA